MSICLDVSASPHVPEVQLAMTCDRGISPICLDSLGANLPLPLPRQIVEASGGGRVASCTVGNVKECRPLLPVLPWLVAGLFLFGCQSSPEITEARNPSTPIPTNEPTLAPTLIPSPTPSLVPTAVPTPTMTPTATLVPSPTPTSTPSPPPTATPTFKATATQTPTAGNSA